MTLAELMEIALYDPQHGYYAGAAQRSGRAGDFFTSVDVGTLFGELLAVQFDEMRRLLDAVSGAAHLDLVEVGSGNGRLSRDVLDAARTEHPQTYDAIRLWLVERSAAARGTQRETLGPHGAKLEGTGEDLPSPIHGIIFANELLDAMPAHAVVMREHGLREIFIVEHDGALAEIESEPSTPALAEHFERVGVPLPPGIRTEVSLARGAWIADAAAALEAGFILLIDYGHRARDLYSARHAEGTLMAYRRHMGAVDWRAAPGTVDMTTHVDLTAIRRAAEAAGLQPLGAVDQTYFLTALGLLDRLTGGSDRTALARRLEAKTLLLPGGLGSTMKVLSFGKNVGSPALRGFAAGRLT